MNELIACRSKRASDCLDGKLVKSIMGPDVELEEDGTWDGSTVVCDSCYIALGQPSMHVSEPEAMHYGASIDQGDPR